MGASSAGTGRTTLEQLLGGLNEHERKHAAPEIYLAGDRGLLLTTRVAVVGSRTASADAIKRTQRLCRELVAARVTIVSGLAKGIDHTAHTTAIASNGRTIAVLGTPLDDCFPREHAGLQREIAEKHLVISQFAPGSPVGKGNFPMRNRTMALISNATVIVEAGETSGTLHQGWEALRLGRPLFIMKSLLERPEPLKWTAEMLGHGAHVLAEMDDLLDVLPPPVVEDAHALAAAL